MLWDADMHQHDAEHVKSFCHSELVSIVLRKMNKINKMKKNLKIKVCGMKYSENIQEVALLQPDYLGFIFYPKSPRNFEGEIPEIPSSIKKTGVFVDAPIAFILEKVKQYNFKAVQLHGSESADYCEELRGRLYLNCANPENGICGLPTEIFKVFGIKDEFDFEVLKAYENVVDYFLFDTKGKSKGGNGYAFDWSVLKGYTSKIPIILSGGIGVEELNKIEEILKSDLPIYALDLNSKFETKPALKDVELLKSFLEKINKHNTE